MIEVIAEQVKFDREQVEARLLLFQELLMDKIL